MRLKPLVWNNLLTTISEIPDIMPNADKKATSDGNKTEDTAFGRNASITLTPRKISSPMKNRISPAARDKKPIIDKIRRAEPAFEPVSIKLYVLININSLR